MKPQILASVALAASVLGAGQQLLNLPPCEKGKPRFAALKDRVWPEKPGDGDVCLWVCRFDDVMKYGQERDTAKLSCALTGDKITVSVTDDMKDDVFNYPLTVKVRLPDGWTGVKGGAFLSHDGKPYALVDVIPDRGEVILSRK